MNMVTGIAALLIGLLLIWKGCSDRSGVHPRFLQFEAALVIFPPAVLVFLAFGAVTIVSELLGK